MTDGGPYGSLRVLAFYMYEQRCPNTATDGLRRGDRGRPVRDHDDLHLLLHLADGPERAGRALSHVPTPIERTSAPVRFGYKALLPVALVVWLLPLLAVMLTSIRSQGDIAAGNYWGWPSEFHLFENYSAVFQNSPIGQYIFNSFKVTIPTVIGAVALSCLTGYALAVYRFKGNLVVFFMFVAGNFVPFQILMVPVRDLTLKFGLYDARSGWCCSTWRSRPASARSSCATSSGRCRSN